MCLKLIKCLIVLQYTTEMWKKTQKTETAKLQNKSFVLSPKLLAVTVHIASNQPLGESKCLTGLPSKNLRDMSSNYLFLTCQHSSHITNWDANCLESSAFSDLAPNGSSGKQKEHICLLSADVHCSR